MHFFKSLLTLGLAALSVASPVSNFTNIEGRIIRGDYVEAYQAPWFCGIYRVSKYNDYEYACGSSLIAEKTLLTAAQCLQKGESYVAKCGSNSLLGGPFQEIPIDSYLLHPEYEKVAGDTISNNIALAYLKSAVQCGERVQFLELQTDHVTDSSTYRVYGLDDHPSGNGDDIKPVYALKYLESVLYDTEKCRTYFNPLHSAPFRTLPTSNSTLFFNENVHPGNVILYSIILEPSKEL